MKKHHIGGVGHTKGKALDWPRIEPVYQSTKRIYNVDVVWYVASVGSMQQQLGPATRHLVSIKKHSQRRDSVKSKSRRPSPAHHQQSSSIDEV